MSPSLSSSDFGKLRAFIAVAEALSYTGAAEALGITNSALSRMVRLLEERIGVRLIHRTTRSVVLTEAGDRLFHRVKAAIAELESAVGQAERSRERPSDVVRIHCSRPAADLFIQPILRSFSDAYPAVVLDITLDDQVVDGMAVGYDAMIRIGEVTGRDIISIKLGDDLRQIAVAAPDYLARHGTPKIPHDLLTHRCIGWRLPGHHRPSKWEFCEEGRWFDIVVDGPIIVNSRELAVQAAIDGLGVAFAVQDVIAPHIAAGRLVPLFERWSAPLSSFYLCYAAQRHMTPTLRVFIDAICSRAGGQGE